MMIDIGELSTPWISPTRFVLSSTFNLWICYLLILFYRISYLAFFFKCFFICKKIEKMNLFGALNEILHIKSFAKRFKILNSLFIHCHSLCKVQEFLNVIWLSVFYISEYQRSMFCLTLNPSIAEIIIYNARHITKPKFRSFIPDFSLQLSSYVAHANRKIPWTVLLVHVWNFKQTRAAICSFW